MTHITKSFVCPTAAAAATSAPAASAGLGTDPSTAVASTTTSLGGNKEPKGPSGRKLALANKGFPEQHWPAFVRLVHQSEEVAPVLEVELYRLLQAVDPAIKKIQIKAAFSAGADRKRGRGSRWMCKPELVAQWAPDLVGPEGAEGEPAVLVPVLAPVAGSPAATTAGQGAVPMVID